MKSFHIVLPGHKLGETLGAKNIEIARSFGLDAHMHPGVKVTDTFDKEFLKYNIDKIASVEMRLKGQQGCFLAHFQLWKKCLELKEPIVICEHDGVFVRSLTNDILNFNHVLRLEPFKHWKDDYEDKVNNSLNKNIIIETIPTEFDTHYVGYYGYIIKPQGAKRLIKRAQRKGVKSVDRFIENSIVDIKSVSASVVRLDKEYIGRVRELSTTNR